MSSEELKLSIPEYDKSLLAKKGFQVGKQFSSGGFSIVCKAEYDRIGTIAVKIIDLQKSTKDYKNRFLPRELYSMEKLKHPNIVVIHRIYTIACRVYIFMELAEGGDLLDMISDGPLEESKAKEIYKQIAKALNYIHSMGFAHRDVKCENILLNKQKTIAKLADFGFTRTVFDNESGRRLLSDTYCGSAAYASPEILKAEPYNAMKSDVWSLGVVLYVILNNQMPFSSSDLKKMRDKQKQRKYIYKNKSLSESVMDLIDKHLEPKPLQRPNMTEILEHKWLN